MTLTLATNLHCLVDTLVLHISLSSYLYTPDAFDAHLIPFMKQAMIAALEGDPKMGAGCVVKDTQAAASAWESKQVSE